MARPENIAIDRHITSEELLKRIKSLEKDTKVLQRLYFIKYRYEGVSVEDAAERVEISKPVAYIWQDRWNKEGYDGLKPKFAGGKPPKLNNNQRDQLKEILNTRDDWTTGEIRKLISKEFKVEYTLKQIRIILRKFGMKFSKPFQHDYRRPEDADEILKKLPELNGDTIIGFFDESSPQTTANTQRLWSFRKPTIYKNTTKLKANSFGFYALNGNSVIDFKERSKKEYVCEFFDEIRLKNPVKNIVVILDNFRSHRANATLNYANKIGIELVFLPPYSPDLNPIEYIWKSIKKIISKEFIIDQSHMKRIILDAFLNFSSQLSFARRWIEKFMGDKLEMLGS